MLFVEKNNVQAGDTVAELNDAPIPPLPVSNIVPCTDYSPLGLKRQSVVAEGLERYSAVSERQSTNAEASSLSVGCNATNYEQTPLERSSILLEGGGGNSKVSHGHRDCQQDEETSLQRTSVRFAEHVTVHVLPETRKLQPIVSSNDLGASDRGCRHADAQRLHADTQRNQDHEPDFNTGVPAQPDEEKHARHAGFCRYPSFRAEFDIGAEELQNLEETMHSGDESIGCLNYGCPTDPSKEVLLKLETTSRPSAKRIYALSKLLIYFSIALLIMTVICKQGFQDVFSTSPWFHILSVALAAPIVVLTAMVAVEFFWRLHRVRQMGLKWSQRRWRLSLENLVQVLAVLVSSVAWLVPNALEIALWCDPPNDQIHWWAAARWSARMLVITTFLLRALDLNFQTKSFDGSSKDVMMLDGGLCVWPLMLLAWLAPCGVILARAIIGTMEDPLVEDEYPGECDPASWPFGSVCGEYGGSSAWLIFGIGAFVPIYFFIYLGLVYRAYSYVSKCSYSTHRMANILLALSFRQNLVTFTITLLSLILLGFINYNSCEAIFTSWLAGLMPAEVVLAATISLPARLFMPEIPTPETIQQFKLEGINQVFAWAESESAATLERVSVNINKMSAELPPPEHIFCFETALKCLYWNWCVYLHSVQDGVEDWGCMDILTAMSMYNLKGYQIIEEDSTDVKCLIGWNERTCVIAFRGSVTMRNFVQNIKLLMRDHEHTRKVKAGVFSHQPRVHSGFSSCWTRCGFNQRVQQAVQRVCQQQGVPEGQGMNLIVTGHSLGAALAMLAAWDLSVPDNFNFSSVRCYTFGCPHVGNASFKADYDGQVPDTWNVINDQDAVARSGKLSSVFIRLFERPGNKVLVDKKGDMLVAPTPLESYLQLVPGIASWDDHVMSSYDNVMLKVCAAQFTRKGFKGGLAGMLSILSQSKMQRYYKGKGLDVFVELDQIRQSEVPRIFSRTSGPSGILQRLSGLMLATSWNSSASQLEGRPADVVAPAAPAYGLSRV